MGKKDLTLTDYLYTAKKEKEVLNMSNAVDELIEDGRQEGIAQGIICGMIETCHELGVSKIDTLNRIIQKFSCSEEESRKYMAMYWK